MNSRDLHPTLPPLHALVDATDRGLHEWVHAYIPESVRRAALEDELRFWLQTAAQDLDYANEYAKVAPPERSTSGGLP